MGLIPPSFIAANYDSWFPVSLCKFGYLIKSSYFLETYLWPFLSVGLRPASVEGSLLQRGFVFASARWLRALSIQNDIN